MLMACDEALQIHETLIHPMRSLLGGERLGVFYFGWVVPYLLMIGFLVPIMLRFLMALPPKSRRWFLAAGVTYLSGAIGMEMLDGRYLEARDGAKDLTYGLLTVVEEGLEMIGLVVFIHALLRHICDHHPHARLLFSLNGGAAIVRKTTLPTPSR